MRISVHTKKANTRYRVFAGPERNKAMSFDKKFTKNYTKKSLPTVCCCSCTDTTATLAIGTCCHMCVISSLLDRSTDSFFSGWCFLYACVYHFCGGGIVMFPCSIYQTSPEDSKNRDTCLGCCLAPCYCIPCQQWKAMSQGSGGTASAMERML